MSNMTPTYNHPLSLTLPVTSVVRRLETEAHLSTSLSRTEINQINFACLPNQSSTPIHVAAKPRRGRRPKIPTEFRDQIRRLKKQNMERRRRACISDKMNALHNLALQLIGIDPLEQNKVEKSDILGVCFTIFDGIAKIVREKPEILSRLQKLNSSILKPNSEDAQSVTVSTISPLLRPSFKGAFKRPMDINSLSPMDNSYQKSDFSSPNYSNLIHENNGIKNFSDQPRLNETTVSPYKHYPFKMPLKYRLSYGNKYMNGSLPKQQPTEFRFDSSKSCRYSSLQVSHRSPNMNQSKSVKDTVWRPYLD